MPINQAMTNPKIVEISNDVESAIYLDGKLITSGEYPEVFRQFLEALGYSYEYREDWEMDFPYPETCPPSLTGKTPAS